MKFVVIKDGKAGQVDVNELLQRVFESPIGTAMEFVDVVKG
jgi:hypothetical protein